MTEGEKWKQCQILFYWAPKSLQTVNVAMKLRCLLLGRKAVSNLDSIVKSMGTRLKTLNKLPTMVGIKSHLLPWHMRPEIT